MIHRRRQDGHKNSAADALSSDIREKLISREEPHLAVPGSRLPTLENACSFVQARETDLFQFRSLLLPQFVPCLPSQAGRLEFYVRRSRLCYETMKYNAAIPCLTVSLSLQKIPASTRWHLYYCSVLSSLHISQHKFKLLWHLFFQKLLVCHVVYL